MVDVKTSYANMVSGVKKKTSITFYIILVGIIAGLGSIAFQYLCQIGVHFFLDYLAGYRPPAIAGETELFNPTSTPFNRWVLLLLPAIGGLISGWIAYAFAPEAGGHGTDAAIEAYHNNDGFIRGRIPIVKSITSAITITTGGSGGREGPIAQIGAGFGSYIATKLGLGVRERRILMAAGMGAGIGSIFRAPLAGALFVSEVLYRNPEFESDVIIPTGIASIIAYCIFCMFFGWGSLFDTEDFIFNNPLELVPYALFSLVLVAAGILYIKCFYGVHHIFSRIKTPNYIKPAIGGLLTGIIGFFLPQTLSFGYGYSQQALYNQLPALLLLGIAFGKILTTSFSIASGGSGGVFGPSIVIGGALGGAVGRIFHILIPGIVTQPGAFVVVGMAGFFTVVSKTPISTIIFVSEMTNSYHLLLPSFLVCLLGYVLSRKYTIFIKQVKSRVDSNAHRGEFFVDVLEKIKVGDLISNFSSYNAVPENMSFSDFKRLFSNSSQHYFPVVDSAGKLKGIFSVNDVRGVLFNQEIDNVVMMRDICTTDIIFVTPLDDLNEALKKFTIRNIQSIPVVMDDDHSRLIGMLDRREVIRVYNKKIEEMKSNKV